MTRETKTALINLAAEIVTDADFISPYRDNHPRTRVSDKLLRQAERQQAKLKDWAYRLRVIADSEEA